jgi:hypothetical protein
METDSTEATFDAEAIAALRSVIAEALEYNTDMEERGYHTGGPPDIEGVYDSRVWLLAEGAKRLVDENQHLRGELHIVAKFLRDCGYTSTKEGEQLEELYQRIRKYEVC